MPITPASTRNLPLPVQIFSAAMEQQLPLADYAQRLGISHESLRAVVTAQRTQVEPATLDHLANVYNQSRETLREQLSIAPPNESFGAWLKRNMEGVSQHALRNRVQMDTKTLKQLLNAEALPDSDQAERISRALYIDRTEIACVVIANLIHQADADRLTPTTSTSPGESTPPAATTAPAPAVSRSTRRQNAMAHADTTAAEAAAATGGVVVEPALERERPHRAASARRVSATLDAATEPVSVSEDAERRRPAARRQAGVPTAAPTSAPTAESTLEPTNESGAQGVERPRRPAARRPTNTTAAVSATTLTPESTVDPVPAPEVEHPRRSASRRQAGTTTAAKSETTSPVGSIAHRNNSGAATTDSETLGAFNTPNHDTSRKQRRSGPVSKKGSAESASAHADVARPVGLALETDVAVSRTPPSDAYQPPPLVSDATAAPAAAATTPATASPTAELAPAFVTAILAADPTTLQLSPDEARLIRHWRQLHPHGRRATLHYIGSLLVDD